MLKKITDIDFDKIKDDPVRPELDMKYRLMYGREVYAIEEDEKIKAVICVAYSKIVPKKLCHLNLFARKDGNIAVFYTVWSYEKGYGRNIVFAVRDEIKNKNLRINRFVTLSPKTQMAYDFHTKNGAVLISSNETSDNYEYITGDL